MGLSADRKTDQLGTADVAYPVLLKYPVEANTTIYAGGLVAINAAGNAVPASATSAYKCVGRAERQCANQTTNGTISPDGIATGTAGSISVPVHQGCFYFAINADSTITKANFGANVYASDDQTVSLSDAGGTRPYAGYIVDPAGAMAPSPLSNSVGVFVGVANPYAVNPELAFATQYKARNVVTSLQAYGGTGTNTLTQTTLASGWVAQDGVTNAVGDIVFIQGGTTNLTGAKDSGPWQISVLGSASIKWVLVRPDWWSTGMVAPVGAVIDIGGEGAIWGGTAWKSFAAVGSAVVGTNDPTFYVGRMTQSVALTASAKTITNVGVYSATTTGIITQFVAAGGTTTSTVSYGLVAAASPGYAGTATFTVNALASGQAKNGTADTSTVTVTVVNW